MRSETALGEIILGRCTNAIISDLCELCMESRPGQKGKIGIPKESKTRDITLFPVQNCMSLLSAQI